MPYVSMMYLLWKLSLHHPNNLEGEKRALATVDMILIQGRGIYMHAYDGMCVCQGNGTEEKGFKLNFLS